MKQVLEIQVFDGDKLLARQVFDQGKIVIGRILSADFRVSDARVSRIHALLERLDDGTLRLTDLASTHGTHVNGEKIIERVVGPDDDIRVATLKLQLTYRLLAEEAPAMAIPSSMTPAASAPEVPQQGDVALDSGAMVQISSPPPSSSAPSAAPAVRVSSEPTGIRSLKDTMRARGVMDSMGAFQEELEITVYWEETVLNVDHCRDRTKTVRIGEAPGNDYVVSSHVLPPTYDFIHVKGSSAEIVLHPSMKGSARVGGQMQTLEQLMQSGRSTISIHGQDIAKIRVGSVHFFLMFVGRPPALVRADVFDQGKLFWFLQISFLVLVAVFLGFGSYFQPPIEGQVREFPEKFRKIIVQNYRKRPEPVKQVEAAKAQKGTTNKITQATSPGGGNAGAGAREAGAEGRRGNPTSQKTSGRTQRVAKTPVPTKEPLKAAPVPVPKKVAPVSKTTAPTKKPVKKVDTKKPLPRLTKNPKAPPSTVVAKPGGKPVETPAQSIMETLKNSGLGAKLGETSKAGSNDFDKAFEGTGSDSGSAQGSGGSGLQGRGAGGGGQTVGVQGLGSQGFGQGADGKGTGAIPGKQGVTVGTEMTNVYVVGGLSREEIERVVNAHRNEVTFCYQRQLQKDPGLSGKVTLKWQILGGGVVSGVSVAQNTTQSSVLAQCIRNALRGWRFPSPPQGTKVDVEWPWVFKPSGS